MSSEIMPEEKVVNFIEQGEALLAQNRPKDALKIFRENLDHEAAQHDVYYLMAQACSDLEMYDQSLAFLLEAHTLDPQNSRNNEKIALHYYKTSDHHEAYKYFKKIGIRSIDSVDSLNSYALCAEKVGNNSDCMEALERSLRLDSQQHKVEERLQDIRRRITGKHTSDRKRISFFTTNDLFLRNIKAHLEKKYVISQFSGSTISAIAGMMQESEVSWFEWCDNLIVRASKLPKYGKTICRLHRYEAFTDMPAKVNWNNVDHLICVSKYMAEFVREKFDIQIPITVVKHGLDLQRFAPPENKTYGKNLAYVGFVKMQKGPELLAQCFAKIHSYDPEYRFHIAGHFDPVIERYFNHLCEELSIPVQYHGWVEDIASWLHDKDYIISSSMSESFQFSVIEGISSGLMPLVHNWPGSNEFYQKETMFNTVDECLALLQQYEKSDKNIIASENRKLMAEKFSLDTQFKAIDDVIDLYLE